MRGGERGKGYQRSPPERGEVARKGPNIGVSDLAIREIRGWNA